MANEKIVNRSLTFEGALTILFIAFKLAHIIDWSWWWVFSPLWISILLAIGWAILEEM